jgi:hypothetical protein
MPRPSTPRRPLRYFNSSPEVIRLAVLMYVRFPLRSVMWNNKPWPYGVEQHPP